MKECIATSTKYMVTATTYHTAPVCTQKTQEPVLRLPMSK